MRLGAFAIASLSIFPQLEYGMEKLAYVFEAVVWLRHSRNKMAFTLESFVSTVGSGGIQVALWQSYRWGYGQPNIMPLTIGGLAILRLRAIFFG
jgi:hypothetical protein